MKRRKNNGFTLIELLAVIVILAIIALIATPIILGIVLISKFIRMCLEKYFEQTYSMIIAFVLSSIVMILYPLFQLETSLLEIIVGLFLFLIGGFISYHLEKQ